MAEIGSRLREVSGEGGEKRMHGRPFDNIRPLLCSLNLKPHRVHTNGLAGDYSRKEPRGRIVASLVSYQGAEGHFREDGVTVLCALALPYQHHHAGSVDVAGLETGNLTYPRSRAGHHERGSMLQAGGDAGKPLNLVFVRYHREFPWQGGQTGKSIMWGMDPFSQREGRTCVRASIAFRVGGQVSSV